MMDTAIIGQQQQAGGILVQSTHRIDPLWNINQIHDNLLTGMSATGDIIRRFIQGYVDQFMGGFDDLAVDFNVIPVRVNFRTELDNDLAVNRNLAGNNKLLPFSARADAG